METLIKSFAQIVQSDFLSVCSKNRSNTGVLRGFFGHTGRKYAYKMCKVIYSVFPYIHCYYYLPFITNCQEFNRFFVTKHKKGDFSHTFLYFCKITLNILQKYVYF